MRNVVVTGIGLVTCLGLNKADVVHKLKNLQHGFVRYPPFEEDPKIPVHVAAPIPGFVTNSPDPEDWSYPDDMKLRLEQLRGLSPNALYSHYALKNAIADSGLSPEEVSNPRTGLYTASSGSAALTHYHLDRMKRVGPMRCSPLGIVASIAGTLNFNLVASYKIQGATTGFVSACASSGHALGFSYDEIATGRQDRMLVVGAEDFTLETVVPFAGMRVLTPAEDPDRASRPFDRDRDGFVGTGGSVVLVLEEESIARERNAPIYARFAGWGQSTDGYHVAISHPEGEGLIRAINNALTSAELNAEDVDYINAHATSTATGDVSECKAIRSVFGQIDSPPAVSSTKALTGHALSLSSIMEAAFSVLSIAEDFTPGSAHIENLDPLCHDLNIIRESQDQGPETVLSNSSGFGGANVSLLFQKP